MDTDLLYVYDLGEVVMMNEAAVSLITIRSSHLLFMRHHFIQ